MAGVKNILIQLFNLGGLFCEHLCNRWQKIKHLSGAKFLRYLIIVVITAMFFSFAKCENISAII